MGMRQSTVNLQWCLCNRARSNISLMLVIGYNRSIVLNDGMFSVQNPVTAPDRGTEAFNKVIEASGLVVVGDDSSETFLSEVLLKYADYHRDKSSGQ